MPVATCLVNENKKELCIIPSYSSEVIRRYLLELEHGRNWDLQRNYIYISIVNKNLIRFQDVTALYSRESLGGEIIHEDLAQ